MVLETERLILRELKEEDYGALCLILQDAEVMYAYEHAFSDSEVRRWLDVQFERYAEYERFGLWAVELKSTGAVIGQCGLTVQDCDGTRALEIGYLFQKAYWHNGYAIEAATECKKYAFDALGADEVFSIIRDTNYASQRVALKKGMSLRSSFIKHYYGLDMPHLVFSVKREEYEKSNA